MTEPQSIDIENIRKVASGLPDEEKKRRQHHVWQHYLRSWAVGGQLFCLRAGRIFPTGTTAVAVERDFYKLQKLTADDFALIKLLVIDATKHPLTKRNHEEFLATLTAPSLFEGRSPELDAIIDTYRTNVLENYHAGIESAFLPLLDRLLQKDATFYEGTDDCINFLHFLCTQHMRTKAIKTRTVAVLKEKSGIDVSRICDVMSHMFAVNAGLSLFLERKQRKLMLIENSTGEPFITGDQPVVNLHGTGGQSPPTELSLYYPLAPHLALILHEVDEEPTFSTEALTREQVLALNEKIVDASHSQVFGNSRESLTHALEQAGK